MRDLSISGDRKDGLALENAARWLDYAISSLNIVDR